MTERLTRKLLNTFREDIPLHERELYDPTLKASESGKLPPLVSPILTKAYDVGEAIFVPPDSPFYPQSDDASDSSAYALVQDYQENPGKYRGFEHIVERIAEFVSENPEEAQKSLFLPHQKRADMPDFTFFEEVVIRALYTINNFEQNNPLHATPLELKREITQSLRNIVQCDDQFCPDLVHDVGQLGVIGTALAFPDAWAKYRHCKTRLLHNVENDDAPEACDSILAPYFARVYPMVLEDLDQMRKDTFDEPLEDYDGTKYPSPFWFQGSGDVWRRSNHGLPDPLNKCQELTEKFHQCVADPTMSPQICYDAYHDHKACRAGINCRYLRVPLARCMVKYSQQMDYNGADECFNRIQNYHQCQTEPASKPDSVEIDALDYILPTPEHIANFKATWRQTLQMASRQPYEVKMFLLANRAKELSNTDLYLNHAQSLFYLKNSNMGFDRVQQLLPYYNLEDSLINPYDEKFFSDSFTLADANIFEQTGYEMKLRREKLIERFQRLVEYMFEKTHPKGRNPEIKSIYPYEDPLVLVNAMSATAEEEDSIPPIYAFAPEFQDPDIDFEDWKWDPEGYDYHDGYRASRREIYDEFKTALNFNYPIGGLKSPTGPSVKQVYYYDTFWNAYFAYQPFTRTSYPFFPISHLYHYQDFNYDTWDESQVLNFPPYPRYTAYNESIHPYMVAKDELLFDGDKRLAACDYNSNLDTYLMQTGVYYGNPQLDGGKVLDHFRMYFKDHDKYYTCYDDDTRCIPSRYPGDNYGTFYDENLNTNWFYRPDTHEYYFYDEDKNRVVYNIHNRTTHRYHLTGQVEYLCEEEQIEMIYFFQRKFSEFKAGDQSILAERSNNNEDSPFRVDKFNNPLLLEDIPIADIDKLTYEIPNQDQYDAYEYVDTRTTEQIENLITLPLPSERGDPSFLEKMKDLFKYQEFNWLRKYDLIGMDFEQKFSDNLEDTIRREQEAKKAAYKHLQQGQTYKYRKYLRFGTYELDKRDGQRIDEALTTYFYELPYLQSPYFKLYKQHPPPTVITRDKSDGTEITDYVIDRSSLIVKAFRERHNLTYKEYLEYVLFSKHIKKQIDELIEYEKFNEHQKLLEFVEYKQHQVRNLKLTFSEKIRRQQELSRRFGRVAPDFTKYGNVYGYNPHAFDTPYEMPYPLDIYNPKRAPHVKFYIDDV